MSSLGKARTAEGVGTGATLELGELNQDLRAILGRPCFSCIRIAELLRKHGEQIERKAEAEQAAVIFWLLVRYARHGKDWADKASDELGALAGATP